MLKILLVDDERNILNLLRHLITVPETEVIADTQSSSEAIELARTAHPDLIISDIRMPELSGLDMIREIRKFDPNIRFILISGYQDFEYAYNALKLGVSEYLLKPVRQAELNEAIQKLALERQGKAPEISPESSSFMPLTREPELNSEKKRWLQTIVDHIQGNAAGSMSLQLTTPSFSVEAEEIRGIIIHLDIHAEQNSISSGEISRYLSDISSRITGILSILADETEFVINGSWCYLMIAHHAAPDVWNQVIRRCNLYLKEEKYKYEDRLTATISIGSRQRDYADLPLSLLHAKYAMMGRIEFGCGKILDYDSRSLCVNKTFFTEEDLARYLGTVQSHDLQAAEIELEHLLDGIRVPDSQGAVYYNAALQVTERTLTALALASGGSRQSPLNFEEQIEDCADREQLKSYLRNWLEKNIRHYHDPAVSREGRLVRSAKEFVNEHYGEQIGLKETADFISLNPVYFSSIFKEQTGENFTNYVQNVRISKAKELLRSSNLTVKKIAFQVGYLDEKYFSKLFLKITGVKPLEYRKYYS